MQYHILAVGDVVGEPGLRHLERNLRPLQKLKQIHFYSCQWGKCRRCGFDAGTGRAHPGCRSRRGDLGQPLLWQDADQKFFGGHALAAAARELYRADAGPRL